MHRSHALSAHARYPLAAPNQRAAPSSAAAEDRSPKKQTNTKMASKAAARRRLRSLRAVLNKDLSGDAPGALLFVCGVDGKDN